MTVSTTSSEGITTNSTQAERYAAGKALRSKAPRTSHAEWAAASDRPDPISLLEESNRTRVQELVPIRYGRMSLSPSRSYAARQGSWRLTWRTRPSQASPYSSAGMHT